MNALAHAWYGGSATVRVVLRRDGLEVTNTGSFLLDRERRGGRWVYTAR